MRQFFNGWRRKAGFVTAVLALTFVVGWIASLKQTNGIAFPYNQGEIILTSSNQGLSWVRFHGSPKKPTLHLSPDDVLPRSIWDTPREIAFFRVVDPRVDWTRRWHCCGFGYCAGLTFYGGVKRIEGTEYALPYGDVIVWIVPYWSIVLPLATLSAWLLWLRRELNSSSKSHVERGGDIAPLRH